MINEMYKISKPLIFSLFNGEQSHKLLEMYSQFMVKANLLKPINGDLKYIDISNGAGFNKDADIPSEFLRYLGFTRELVGTVTNEPWSGNPDKFIKRFPRTSSMVNYLGLPGKGADYVSEELRSQRLILPVTLNIAPTPNKESLLEQSLDIENTLNKFKDIEKIDRIEFNASCPNTNQNLKYSNLPWLMEIIERSTRYDQEIYVKISPDVNYLQLQDILLHIYQFDKVKGITLTNTTKDLSPIYVDKDLKKGGASGNTVYDKSVKVQSMAEDIMSTFKRDFKIIASGGINSKERLEERTTKNTVGYQVFTGLIYGGPGFVKKLREV